MKILFVLALTVYVTNTTPTNIKPILRGEWKAIKAKNDLPNLKIPVPNIIVAHTDTEPCHTIDDCKYRVHRIQQIHMRRGFDDIGYNFLIGGDGNIYEGRGIKSGAHTKGYNTISLGVAFIGKFNSISPTKNQLDAAKVFISQSVKDNILSKDYKLYGQRTLTETQSPGDNLFEIIKKWPHFTDKRHHKHFHF